MSYIRVAERRALMLPDSREKRPGVWFQVDMRERYRVASVYDDDTDTLWKTLPMGVSIEVYSRDPVGKVALVRSFASGKNYINDRTFKDNSASRPRGEDEYATSGYFVAVKINLRGGSYYLPVVSIEPEQGKPGEEVYATYDTTEYHIRIKFDHEARLCLVSNLRRRPPW